MVENSARRWAALGLGALTLAGATFVFSTRGMAQGDLPRREGEVRRDGEVRREGGDLRRDQPGPRPEGRPGFNGPPGGFPGGPPMGMGPMMGGPVMTATPTTVYVLRGNSLFAFDAQTLRLKARTELPPPEFGPGGPGFPGGPRPGFPGGGAPGSGAPGGENRF